MVPEFGAELVTPARFFTALEKTRRDNTFNLAPLKVTTYGYLPVDFLHTTTTSI